MVFCPSVKLEGKIVLTGTGTFSMLQMNYALILDELYLNMSCSNRFVVEIVDDSFSEIVYCLNGSLRRSVASRRCFIDGGRKKLNGVSLQTSFMS